MSRKNYECTSLCKLLYLSREARDYRAQTDKRRGIKVLYKRGRPVTRMRSQIIEFYTCIALRNCLKSPSKLATVVEIFLCVAFFKTRGQCFIASICIITLTDKMLVQCDIS